MMPTAPVRSAAPFVLAVVVAMTVLVPRAGAATLSDREVRDSIRGAWAGGIAGAAWGFPVEFDFNGRIVPRHRMPRYSMREANRYTFDHKGGPDETYMELPFLDPLSRDPYASWPEWGAALSSSRFRLFSANLRARRLLRGGLAAPASGDPANNPYAYNIDFQIESDFAGLVAPAQPGAAVEIAWRAGHLTNYGDGVYGGVMVAAMTAEAFRARKLDQIIQAGRLAVPVGSSYRAMIEDVLRWHGAHPGSWRKTWALLERRWNRHDPSVKRDHRHIKHEFNIDARLNGAYILLGLLYGRGDFTRTLRIAIRAGQDSDCNPNNAGSILGAWHGLRGLPSRFRKGLAYGNPIRQTDYTLRRAIDATLAAARGVTAARGGAGESGIWEIPDSPLVPPILEQWPLVPDEPPQLAATASPSGLTVDFEALAQDPDGISDYWWSFGDLSAAPGASPSHTYRAPGTYRATVWASDSLGRTGSRVLTVTIP